jgi:imidazole glycerol phosphate synthase glutamine amidotransferase subunit
LKSVLLLDYGMGNLRSLGRALEAVGASVTIGNAAAQIAQADRLVIPGQGAFHQAMGRMNELAVVDAVRSHLLSGKPTLGVCLGLQLLFESSEEAPGIAGLGVIPGAVKLLPLAPGIKRPHMGWSPVYHDGSHPVLSASPSGEAYYFVHSFAAGEAPGFEIATARHGIDFVAAVAKDALVATQFHPEKSQDAGARLLGAWLGC